MQLYLITGFLGAGKTTFLREFVRQFAGQRLRLIINEFGKAGVDGALLRDVNAALAEINGGSVFCACRLDRFEEELQRTVDDGPDVVLVEASGLADPTGVEQVLAAPGFSSIRYRGSVCLVDAPRLERVLHTARMCPRQIRISSLILLNKTDLATAAQVEAARTAVEELNPVAVVRETQFGRFEAGWMEDIHPLTGAGLDTRPDICLQKQLIRLDEGMTAEQLGSILRLMAEDTWRIKGVAELEGRRLLVDCVGPSVKVSDTTVETEHKNQLVLLAGQGMALRRAIKQAQKWYPGLFWEEHTAD
ncbi:GTP-binding protein [Pseudoflavonifractor capillosus]|uniref:GTP-binding protein n=1 Tax=Pseudoflavonifractor capillosus TaxID=106588 RepID=A0A921STE2_9FIRM|nr:GTP-binding protein [Pseudoflavonifractor capillosus]HJG87576.1 GTP-binding protein [Pseudoflavonifractor capillosus]